MNTEGFDWIDRYLTHELSPEERFEFEKEMESNSEFRKEVELYRKLRQGLIYDRSLKMLEKLKVHDRERYSNGFKSKNFFYNLAWIRIAAFIVIGSGFVYMYYNLHKAEELKLAEKGSASQKQEELVLPNDTFLVSNRMVNNPADTHIAEVVKNSGISTKKFIEDPEEIYLAYFEPIKEDGLFSGSRSEEDLEPYDIYLIKYKESKYEEALEAFGSLSPVMQKMPEALFVKANILMALNKTEEAKGILKDLMNYDPFIYKDEIRWLYSLCLVRAGFLDSARKIVVHNLNSDYSKSNVRIHNFLKDLGSN